MQTAFAALSLVATVQAAQQWNNVASPDFDKVTEALSIAFAPDGKTGFTGVGINGVGTQILKTTDGGSSWNKVWPDNTTQNPANLFLGAACRGRTSAVITGVITEQWTADGNTFKPSTNDFVTPAQDAGNVPDGDFGITINNGKYNGIATSKTGLSWTNFDYGANATLFPSRYGSWPTATTWYATGGNFPTSNTNEMLIPHTSKLARTKEGRFEWTYGDKAPLQDPVDCSVDPTNCYSAGVFKTADAGKTWTQVYSDINNGTNIYPNDIDCFDANHCVMVMEGARCQIKVTTDGGATWTKTMDDSDTACSLIYAKMLSTTEIWVAGGHLSAVNFEGRFWHSTDGGATWVKEAHKAIYVLDLDMSPVFGYALALDASGSGITLLSYTASDEE
jgi:photosystem II stability/assembly factor-like uncharacterized protein